MNVPLLLLLLLMGAVVLLVGCGGLVIGGGVGLLMGSILLRVSVAVANRFPGKSAPPPDEFGQWDDWDSDDPGPNARPRNERAVPEPSIATGMLVTFVLGVASAVGYLALAFVLGEVFGFDGPDEGPVLVLLFLFGLPFTGLALTLLLVALVPTTFARAAFVAFVYHLLVAFGLAAVGAFVVALGFVFG